MSLLKTGEYMGVLWRMLWLEHADAAAGGVLRAHQSFDESRTEFYRQLVKVNQLMNRQLNQRRRHVETPPVVKST